MFWSLHYATAWLLSGVTLRKSYVGYPSYEKGAALEQKNRLRLE